MPQTNEPEVLGINYAFLSMYCFKMKLRKEHRPVLAKDSFFVRSVLELK